jgi:hypothetical protein
VTELTKETEPPDNSLTVLRAELDELRRRVGLIVAEIDLLQVEAAASKRQVVSGASVLVAALALVVSVGTFVVGQVNVIADRQIQDNVPPWLACCRRSRPRGVPPVPGDLSRDSPTSWAAPHSQQRRTGLDIHDRPPRRTVEMTRYPLALSESCRQRVSVRIPLRVPLVRRRGIRAFDERRGRRSRWRPWTMRCLLSTHELTQQAW